MTVKTTPPQGDTASGPQGTQTDPEATAPPAAEQGDQGEPTSSNGTDWVREARKWEARAKKDREQLLALQEQVKQLVSPEQVKTTEVELSTARGELEAARLEALKYRVALAEGLPVDLAARLVGGDEEALMADAKQLKQLVRPAKGTPDAAAGTAPGTTTPPKMSADQALRAALGLP